MKKEFVYCGLVYMGDQREKYEKIIAQKYGENAELRNYDYDEIHEHRAELFATQEILDKDFKGTPKLIH